MSSAGRKPRAEHDFYETPAWCVHRLLEGCSALRRGGSCWLDPATGRGAIIDAVNSFEPQTVRSWRGFEINPAQVALLNARLPGVVQLRDFRDVPPEPGYFDVIITNPPFSLAHEYIEHAWAWSPQILVLLLRLNFLASEGRAAFLRTHPPDVYVLPNRPSFTGDGSTDSIEYAWFVWHPTAPSRVSGRLQVLAVTPRAERRGIGG